MLLNTRIFKNRRVFIRIEANIEKKVARLVFEDNGIGIAHEHLEKIYDMFFRATEEAEGSGLGLYIVKQTVDKIKGKIQIFSPGKGMGLRVMVEIPNLTPPAGQS
ncbi:MAG: ATP-binding protein [Microscillaceae bacterium]|nr:ATP-binding protein [Microscillaceae bacterium]